MILDSCCFTRILYIPKNTVYSLQGEFLSTNGPKRLKFGVRIITLVFFCILRPMHSKLTVLSYINTVVIVNDIVLSHSCQKLKMYGKMALKIDIGISSALSFIRIKFSLFFFKIFCHVCAFDIDLYEI